jgi:uncharacterized protein
MIRSLLAVAALSLLVQLPARAADAPAAELARLMVTRDDWTRGVEMVARDWQGELQGHPGGKLTLPQDFGAVARAEVEKVLPFEELVGMHARELSAAYSEKEIAELVVFFRSPLGQKYVKAAPQEVEKVAQLVQQRFVQKKPEVMQKLTSGLRHPDPKKAELKHPELKHPEPTPADPRVAK